MVKRKALISLIASLFLTGTVVAQETFDACKFAMPPEKYIIDITSLVAKSGPVTIKFTDSMEELNLMCLLPSTNITLGCADHNKREIKMYVLLDDKQKSCVIVHELAHINGWPSDHPMN